MVGTDIRALSALDALIRVDPGSSVCAVQTHCVLRTHLHTWVGKAALTAVCHIDPLFRTRVTGEFDHIEVVNQDILKVDVETLVKEKLDGGPVKLVANLPYYITTPIVMKFLEEDIPVTDIVVMVQKEVADRMNAVPSTKDYGALSVAVQYYCDTEIVAKAPRHMFIPQPNVDSTVIGLHVREERKYPVDNEDIFFKTVKAAFGQRRKTLLNALGGLGFLSKDDIKEVLQMANIDEKRRGETLSIEEFATLANAVNTKVPSK